MLEAHRIAVLEHLDRHEVRHALRRHAVHEAVAAVVSAVAARIGKHRHEIASGARMTACDRRHAGSTERGSGRALRDRLRQRAEHDVEQAADDFEIAADRCRIFYVEQAPIRDVEFRRPERAAVHRHFGKDVLERDVAARQRCRQREVDRSARRVVGPGEIEVEIGTGFRQSQGEPHRFVDDAVIVEEIFELVGAVRDFRDVGAHLCFRSVHHFTDAVGEPLTAVALEQRVEASPTDIEHIAHRREIAGDLVWQSHVAGEHLHQLLVQLSAVVELHRRDDQSLLMDLGRVRCPAARHRSGPASGRCTCRCSGPSIPCWRRRKPPATSPGSSGMGPSGGHERPGPELDRPRWIMIGEESMLWSAIFLDALEHLADVPAYLSALVPPAVDEALVA